MLCSNCSARVDPVIALDIDGTLGDYHSHFLRFASLYLGGTEDGHLMNLLKGSVNTYGGVESFREYCSRAFGITTEQYRAIKLAYRQGAMKRSMPLLPDAVNVYWSLEQISEVWLTTTRPYLSLDTVMTDTLFWLDINGIGNFAGLLFDDDKYRKLYELVDPERVVAVLDDNWEMYDSAADIFGDEVPILISGKFNSDVSRPNMMPLNSASRRCFIKVAHWKQEVSA